MTALVHTARLAVTFELLKSRTTRYVAMLASTSRAPKRDMIQTVAVAEGTKVTRFTSVISVKADA